VGIDLAYFAAAGDDDAAAAAVRPGGPLGWPERTGTRLVGLWRRREPVVTALGPAYDGFEVRGWDPVIALADLEALLRGVDLRVVEQDPRVGGVLDGPEAAGTVATVSDSLRDALARLPDAQVAPVAERWAATGAFHAPGWERVGVAEHAGFLRRLRALAATAAARGHHLYCYLR
jgi:hypothetical protein